MKNKMRGLLLAYAAMSMANDFNQQETYKDVIDEEEIKIINKEKKKKRLEHKGVKGYVYGDKVVYARNKRNADRKAKLKGYTKN